MTTNPQLIEVLIADRRNAKLRAAQRRATRIRTWRRRQDPISCP